MKDCDFIPAKYHEVRTLRHALKRRASCLASLLVIMAVWIVMHQHRISTAQAMLPELDRQQEQIEIHMAKKQAMESRRANLRNHKRLLGELENAVSLELAFSEIGRRLPKTVVLTELTLTSPSLARFSLVNEEPEDPPPARGRNPRRGAVAAKPWRDTVSTTPMMSIEGVAVANPDVAVFVANLESSPLYDRVNLKETREPIVWAGRRAQRFELTCEVVAQQGKAR
ncbi:MAG: PilN domain-containing protein [Planctomycetota bacterium]